MFNSETAAGEKALYTFTPPVGTCPIHGEVRADFNVAYFSNGATHQTSPLCGKCFVDFFERNITHVEVAP